MTLPKYPTEVLLVYTPTPGGSSHSVSIPRAYTHFIAESEEHLNKILEFKKNEIKERSYETAERWEQTYGPNWAEDYHKSIGHDFYKGIEAELKLLPMSFEQYNDFVAESILTPAQNPLRFMDEEAFYDAHDALHPYNVERSAIHHSFTMSERLVGSITSQYFKYKMDGAEYFASRLVDLSDQSTFITLDEMRDAVCANNKALQADEEASTSKAPLSMEVLQRLWRELSDIPVDEEDNIDQPFLHFQKGESREKVWHWFEDQNPSFSVAHAMRGEFKDRVNDPLVQEPQSHSAFNLS